MRLEYQVTQLRIRHEVKWTPDSGGGWTAHHLIRHNSLTVREKAQLRFEIVLYEGLEESAHILEFLPHHVSVSGSHKNASPPKNKLILTHLRFWNLTQAWKQ